ncbi:NrdH-redoxin [Patescibacteria group bacterium]|nr:NrdH-redoxin [Patescibacteria group bacterium]MBU4367790.1 NrdH-redoxin [Patescibacteria group bacterium]MBU4461480.1 NrdH-redoxin [Patescibacteria group bacterium]MCG2700388.1 NrdH-redoxin [Candidatus Parcubacteria bacterium]
MPKVRIFSTPSCVYCVTLREYLKKYDVGFEDIDVSKDEEALNEMVEKSNQMAVPVVDIDGKFIVGFDKKKINQLLKIKE